MILRPLFVLALLIFSTLFVDKIIAHELQPATLEIRQQTLERFEVLWRAPVYYGKAHPSVLELPKHWQQVQKPSVTQMSDFALHRFLVNVEQGKIDGDIIYINGLESTITDVFVRFYWLDGSQTTTLARPSNPRIVISGVQSSRQVALDYTLLGASHILEGFDHLLFVFALLLLVSGRRKLIATVTAFTLAHSITLAVATLGLFTLAGPPVEATIALSIIFLASELVKVKQGVASFTAQYPWFVAFSFGLLHGFGFAGALSGVGLPQNEVPVALLMFNVGVELGQLLFIAVVLLAIKLLMKLKQTSEKNIKNQWPKWLENIPAYAIGSMAAFWFVERVSGFI